MDLEQEMQILLNEETYLGNLIEKLSQVVDYANLQSCIADAQKLLKKLYDKKEMVRLELDTLTDDMIKLAEVYALDLPDISKSEVYFDTMD